MNRRAEILRAVSSAAGVLKDFPVEHRTSFDIFGAVTALDIPVLFRPLDKLWGALITVDERLRGIIVTTKLPLAVQRFTLAHELGHLMLDHGLSLDETIGFTGRYSPTSLPIQEAAANTFASELLGSRGLMVAASQRHRWDRNALGDPANIYQLSLRLGLSYQATCWALVAQRVLPEAAATMLQAQPVRDQKQRIAPAELIANTRADVWAFTEGDADTFVEAGPDDLFAVHLQDNASAGFLWQLVDTGTTGHIVEERVGEIDERYGHPTSRVVFVRFDSPGLHRLVFEHVRPWSRVKLAHIDIDIDSYGKEQGGLPRYVRALALEQG